MTGLEEGAGWWMVEKTRHEHVMKVGIILYRVLDKEAGLQTCNSSQNVVIFLKPIRWVEVLNVCFVH